MGDLLERAMQKHIIRLIQQEETKENKENKGHCRRRNTNACDAIHNKYYHIPKKQWKELRSKDYLTTQSYVD